MIQKHRSIYTKCVISPKTLDWDHHPYNSMHDHSVLIRTYHGGSTIFGLWDICCYNLQKRASKFWTYYPSAPDVSHYHKNSLHTYPAQHYVSCGDVSLTLETSECLPRKPATHQVFAVSCSYHKWQLLMFMVICMKFTLTAPMKGMRRECKGVEESVKFWYLWHGVLGGAARFHWFLLQCRKNCLNFAKATRKHYWGFQQWCINLTSSVLIPVPRSGFDSHALFPTVWKNWTVWKNCERGLLS